MSGGTNWKALGASVQREAAANAAKLAQEEEANRVAAFDSERNDHRRIRNSISILADLKTACFVAIEQFNTDVTDKLSRLGLSEKGPTCFTVYKGGGVPCLRFEVDRFEVHITLHQGQREMAGGTERFGVDEDGKLTIRNGAATVTPEAVVERQLKQLIQAQSIT